MVPLLIRVMWYSDLASIRTIGTTPGTEEGDGVVEPSVSAG